VNNAWHKYLEAASGLTEVTQRRAEQLVKGLVKQGEVAAERAEKVVDDLLKRSQQNRKTIAGLVKTETERAVERIGLARQADVQRLERKIAELEKSRSGTTAKKTAKKTAKRAKKSTARKTAAKKTAKTSKTAKTAKKSTGSSS
jgi:polyhydroxyalkanoate synthesis regulator phasin